MGIRHTFIQNLKFYRKQAGLTQEKLAEKIGMSTAYIGDMEARERFPSAETIDKIAAALNIRTVMLFDEFGSPKNIHSSFKKIYASNLEDELKSRINKAIEETCSLI